MNEYKFEIQLFYMVSNFWKMSKDKVYEVFRSLCIVNNNY